MPETGTSQEQSTPPLPEAISPQLQAAIDREMQRIRDGSYDHGRTPPYPSHGACDDIRDIFGPFLFVVWFCCKMAAVEAWTWVRQHREACFVVALLLASLVLNGVLLSNWDGSVKDMACSKWLGDVHLVRAEQRHFRTLNVTLAGRLDRVSETLDRVVRDLDAMDTRVYRVVGSTDDVKVVIGVGFAILAVIMFGGMFIMTYYDPCRY